MRVRLQAPAYQPLPPVVSAEQRVTWTGAEPCRTIRELLELGRAIRSNRPSSAIGAAHARIHNLVSTTADHQRRISKATLLRLVPRMFPHHEELNHRAGAILERRYGSHPQDAELERRILEGGPRALLRSILSTFDRLDCGELTDTGLRVSAMIALREVGTIDDLDVIVPHVRKGNADDRLWGLRAIESMARDDWPARRGTLDADPEIGPLLRADRALTRGERRLVIEAVLERGRVIGVERSKRDKNFNETYFVTFAEKLDGERIIGVYKPEPAPGEFHEESSVAREVTAFLLDDLYLGTELVPPTIEAVFSVDGGATFRYGSMQYFLPNAHDLGTSRLESDREWQTYRTTPAYAIEHDRSLLLRYVYDDVDHNREPDGCGDRNTMLQNDRGALHRKMIDFANCLGARPSWSIHIVNPLPAQLDRTARQNLVSAPLDEVEALAREMVGGRFAAELVARWRHAAQRIS
jgi:hypothetical protein